MAVTRRRFLSYLAVGGTITAAPVVMYRVSPAIRTWARHAVLESHMPSGAVGSLSVTTRETLAALVSTMLEPDIDTSRYLQTLEHRANRIPGHRVLIENFAADLDRESLRKQATSFARVPSDQRIAQWDELRELRTSGASRSLAAILRPSWILYNREIVQPILVRYGMTDAWLRQGYTDFPGQRRGHESYRYPPDHIP
jgi:hypothetical protein